MTDLIFCAQLLSSNVATFSFDDPRLDVDGKLVRLPLAWPDDQVLKEAFVAEDDGSNSVDVASCDSLLFDCSCNEPKPRYITPNFFLLVLQHLDLGYISRDEGLGSQLTFVQVVIWVFRHAEENDACGKRKGWEQTNKLVWCQNKKKKKMAQPVRSRFPFPCPSFSFSLPAHPEHQNTRTPELWYTLAECVPQCRLKPHYGKLFCLQAQGKKKSAALLLCRLFSPCPNDTRHR